MSADVEWGGFTIAGDVDRGSLHIGPVPGRKQVALYLNKPTSFSVLAYFKDEAGAQEALAWMDAMTAKANAVGSALHKVLGGKS
ncbi:MAG: hypothetical protein M3N43_03040 [Actinomycetota bacterium]|nr:hypothetical protein [Actinomycetota bacterium]